MKDLKLNRRDFLKGACVGAFATIAPFRGQAARTNKRPNVLIVIADDMNDYGFYRTLGEVKMPYLEKFKATAMTFDKAYCASPACVPSRAAVFSGLYPHTTGSYLNGSNPWRKSPFTEIEAMPECFKRNGYTTFGRGKLFHSQPYPKRKKAMWDNEVWRGGFGPFPPEADQVKGKFWGCTAWEGPDSDFPDVKNADAAIDFLQQEHDKPFFLTLGLWRPHTPFTAPKRFFQMYNPEDFRIPIPGWREDDMEDIPPLGHKLARVWGERFDICGNENPDLWRKFVHAYCACTTFADWSAGRVIEALEKSQYANNTIVIFWSDNGYHCGEKNHWEKTTLWEQAALTPMAIRLPGMVNPAPAPGVGVNHGKGCARPVNTLDLFPTLVDCCALKGPAHRLQGQSLRPLLENPDAAWERPAITTYGRGYFSARDERYRYIQYPDGTEELYDHETDPHEFENLAHRPELEPVKQRLGKWIPKKWAQSLGGRMG
ncbi:MAG: sulfatase [Planctomycetota bacterium]|jgi:arylsulfatase A-like enzyme